MVEENHRFEKHKKRQTEIQDKRTTNNSQLSAKTFLPRNSLLTDIQTNEHVITVRNILISIFIGLVLHTAAYDYFYKGEVRLVLPLIIQELSTFHLFALIWFGIFLSSSIAYAGFKCWTTVGVRLSPKSSTLKMWNRLWLMLLLVYYSTLLYFVPRLQSNFKLSVTLSLAILMETLRFLMKVHAFVRSNAPRVLNYKRQEERDVMCPKFSHYLRFLFFPTFVYSDRYPMSPEPIRWNFVAKCFLEVLVSALFMAFVIEKSFVDDFHDYGLRKFSLAEIVTKITKHSASAILLGINIFYLLLHSWQNAFAEMFGFADRLFYENWWTSSSYSRYYRTWNVPVHDWLYNYVYKEFNENMWPKNRHVARAVVFLVSAVFHEYVLALMLKFFIPFLFVHFFGIGYPMTYVKIKSHTIGNIFLFSSLAIGLSINIVCYSMEYYARRNVPVQDASFFSYFIPHFIYCNQS